MENGIHIIDLHKTIGKKGIWYGDYIYADENGDGVEASGSANVQPASWNILPVPTLFVKLNVLSLE